MIILYFVACGYEVYVHVGIYFELLDEQNQFKIENLILTRGEISQTSK